MPSVKDTLSAKDVKRGRSRSQEEDAKTGQEENNDRWRNVIYKGLGIKRLEGKFTFEFFICAYLFFINLIADLLQIHSDNGRCLCVCVG